MELYIHSIDRLVRRLFSILVDGRRERGKLGGEIWIPILEAGKER